MLGERRNLTPSEIETASGEWRCIELYPTNHAPRFASILPCTSWVPYRRMIDAHRHVILKIAFLGYAFTTSTADQIGDAAEMLRMPQPTILRFDHKAMRYDLARLAKLFMSDPTLSLLDRLTPDAPCRIRSGPFRSELVYRVISVGPLRVRLRGGAGDVTDVALSDVEAVDIMPVGNEHRRRHAQLESHSI